MADRVRLQEAPAEDQDPLGFLDDLARFEAFSAVGP